METIVQNKKDYTEELIQIEVYQVEEGYFTANFKGKIFSIGEMLYTAVRHLKENQSLEEISAEMSLKYDVHISPKILEENVEQFLKKLKHLPKENLNLHDYIYFKIKLLGKESVRFGSNALSFLFRKRLFIILSAVAICFTLLLIHTMYREGVLLQAPALKESIFGLMMVYLGVGVMGLIHEFGHSSSAAYYGQPSDSIGFGFYLVFPVFYSDVTKVWNLNKKKRIVVNLGGIYFQLIINIFLFLIYMAVNDLALKFSIRYFLLSNLFLMIYSVNPFFRNDGYWVYSDLFGIKNLAKEAKEFPNKIFEKWRGESDLKEVRNLIYKNFPLFIYSMLYNLLMVTFIFALAFLTYKNFIKSQEFLDNMEGFSVTSFESLKALISLSFGLFINLFFFRRIFLQYVIRKKS